MTHTANAIDERHRRRAAKITIWDWALEVRTLLFFMYDYHDHNDRCPDLSFLHSRTASLFSSTLVRRVSTPYLPTTYALPASQCSVLLPT
jgi:hypothetical protein